MHLPYSFGKYVLDRKIAQGGMAEIYHARYICESGFEKTVAVKRILPFWSNNNDFVTMLCDEAKALVNLQHQNIVQVYELGRDGNAFYISMEYVEGVDLRRLFNRTVGCGGLPLKFSCFIVVEMLKALVHSHGRASGIIHRDISPQNILLSFNGEVKVADFGIAKGFHRSFETVVSQVKGKYAYMSPEQSEGKAVDARTDIYSAGVILYELLTKRRLRDSLNDLLTIEEAKRSALPENWDIGIATGLKRTVERALEREQGARYQTASEFLKDMSGFVIENGLVVSSIELSGYLRDIFGEELNDHQKNDMSETEHETKVLSPLPVKKKEGANVLFRYLSLMTFVLLASLFGSGQHSFRGPELSVMDQRMSIPEAQPVPVQSARTEPTISVNARPWGYVYIPGVVSRKETPIKGVKLGPGSYPVKVYYEPEDKWATKNVSLMEGFRTTCLADFAGEPELKCRSVKR